MSTKDNIAFVPQRKSGSPLGILLPTVNVNEQVIEERKLKKQPAPLWYAPGVCESARHVQEVVPVSCAAR